jgi:hypothetical protein
MVFILVLYWELYLYCNCIVMVFTVCSVCLLLLCSFVCCAFFERGGLLYVLCLIVLPLPRGKTHLQSK